ncbi:MAG: DUF4133 domain-containing protein [Chitinophagaceae bacterium]
MAPKNLYFIMIHTLYKVHRKINQPLEFQGLQAQYIGYLATGMTGLLLLFSILYWCGLSPIIGVGFTLGSGTGLLVTLTTISRRYGTYGWMKKNAARRIPKLIQGGPGRIRAPLLRPEPPSDQPTRKFSSIPYPTGR